VGHPFAVQWHSSTKPTLIVLAQKQLSIFEEHSLLLSSVAPGGSTLRPCAAVLSMAASCLCTSEVKVASRVAVSKGLKMMQLLYCLGQLCHCLDIPKNESELNLTTIDQLQKIKLKINLN
jgi:hypothetical protein